MTCMAMLLQRAGISIYTCWNTGTEVEVKGGICVVAKLIHTLSSSTLPTTVGSLVPLSLLQSPLPL